MTERIWRVRLSGPAQADLRGIYRWTVGRFGIEQADAYRDLLNTALEALQAGPELLGARQRPEIASGAYTFHIGGRGRHLILFRIGQDRGQPVIAVGRILHEAMDIVRHLPTGETGAGE